MTPTEEQTYREGIKVSLEMILVQTTKTNGRVRWLEKMVYTALGGLGVLTILVLPIITALIELGKL